MIPAHYLPLSDLRLRGNVSDLYIKKCKKIDLDLSALERLTSLIFTYRPKRRIRLSKAIL